MDKLLAYLIANYQTPVVSLVSGLVDPYFKPSTTTGKPIIDPQLVLPLLPEVAAALKGTAPAVTVTPAQADVINGIAGITQGVLGFYGLVSVDKAVLGDALVAVGARIAPRYPAPKVAP